MHTGSHRHQTTGDYTGRDPKVRPQRVKTIGTQFAIPSDIWILACAYERGDHENRFDTIVAGNAGVTFNARPQTTFVAHFIGDVFLATSFASSLVYGFKIISPPTLWEM